jgi:hypothetical protein
MEFKPLISMGLHYQMEERKKAANKGMIFPFKGKSERERSTFLSIHGEKG